VDRFRNGLRRVGQRVGRGARRVVRVTTFLLLLTACTFPGTVRPTVKIGLVAPFEGRYRYVGYDVIYAAKLALREANEEGGVAGHGVELVAYDDGADPAMAVEQARKLDVDPDVVGAIGHFREETTAAVAATYTEARIPLIAPGVLSPDLTQGGEGIYRLGPTADPLADALVERASRLASPGEIVLVSHDGPLEVSLQRAARERIGRRLPVVSADAPGWESEVLARESSVLICDLEPVRAGEVLSALRQRGWSGRALGGPALAPSDFVAVAGRAAAGTAFVTPWPFPGDVAGGDGFTTAYRRVSNGTEPGPLALPAYEATWALLEALERAGSHGELTREGVAVALAGGGSQGTLGNLTADESREWVDLDLYWYRIGPDGVPVLQG
jgi:branched-chain amino acid transport system substrate-binding protein